MSLFDLQDVCIAIGSLATLDLPMVVDLIGPYCTLTTTNWFLQSLSVIGALSWGDVSRRSYHDPMGKSGIVIPEPQCAVPSSSPTAAAVAASSSPENCFGPIRRGESVHADLVTPSSAGVTKEFRIRSWTGLALSTAVYREVPLSLRNRSEPDLMTSCTLLRYAIADVRSSVSSCVTRAVDSKFLHCFVSRCIAVVSYQDARASGNTALSSPCWDLLATMRRVVNYHSSWSRQRQVELFDASGIWVECQGEWLITTL
ncbi:hypothetical protein F511_07938 [Dorcoceras hygrometricum]|uniref:Uncharacterized protein n=1 Tax=Dorcoceras hygrometricum TaxID=472368 RepID=A0A2Z7A6E4_9LAMI|nr:hypothetical protein F511_07938 [Dorcoceras hygrometricum]